MKRFLLFVFSFCSCYLNAEVYQLQSVRPAVGAGVAVYTAVYMRSPISYLGVISVVPPTAQALFASVVQKAYADANPTAPVRFSGQLFDADNNANFPNLSIMGNVWQMPGLAFFVPSTPVVGPPALALNTALNWGSLGAVTAPFETLLMAKKRVPGYNPAQTGRASALNPAPTNPWGSMLLNALVGQNGFFPVDYRSHTERQLVAALLNGVLTHDVTAGDMYVYTEENTCTDPTPHPHNQGIACIRFYEGLKKHFRGINFHLFFRDFNGDFLKNLSIEEIKKLLDFIAAYTGSPNDFAVAFPAYRIINKELMLSSNASINSDLLNLSDLLKKRRMNDRDFARLKTTLSQVHFSIDVDHLHSVAVGSASIAGTADVNTNDVNNRLRLDIKVQLATSPSLSAATNWRIANPVEISSFIMLLSNYIIENATSTQPFAMYLKSEIFQAVFGKPGITYYHLQ